MQCVNCQFNNMPGTQTCARCGSSLNLTSSMIDVHPPRAGSVALRMRRLLPLHQLKYAIRERNIDLSRIAIRNIDARLPESALLWRLVVPGWAQLYIGERWQGRSLQVIWLLFLFSGLLLFGTTSASFLLGFAFSVHSFAASDIVNRAANDRGVPAQLARSIVISIVLAATLYGPGMFCLTRLADPMTPAYTAGPFREGESLLVNHWAQPDRGSVVLYDMPEYRAGFQRMVNNRPNVAYQGQRIDRVLAVAGDRVEFRSGVLLINGKVSAYQAIERVVLPTFGPMVVQENRLFIIPSTSPDLTFAGDLSLLEQMSHVPVERVHGIVYARLHPLSRFRLIY